jgi:two-component system phosphate regulon response regulator OmpR
MSRAKVLLVEDDAELAGLVVRLLNVQAMDVSHVPTLSAAREALQRHGFDVLVLDIMLPDGSGLDLCREVRNQYPALPVLMLSARGDTIDRVLGLEIGADDYLAKPFDAAELTARLRSLLRRGRFDAGAAATRWQFGRMQIDLLSRTVSIDEVRVELSTTEYKVLLALSEQPGRPIGREQLSRMVQPGAYMPSDRSVDVQVARLRKKLRDRDSAHEWVLTVRGEGYVFTPPSDR